MTTPLASAFRAMPAPPQGASPRPWRQSLKGQRKGRIVSRSGLSDFLKGRREMTEFKTLSGAPLHPEAETLKKRFAGGEIDRRGFLRAMAWLGVAIGGASAFGGKSMAQEAPKDGGSL